MTGARDHGDLLATAAAWVLGALPDDEARRFAEHLPDCAECRAEVARLQTAADALPLGAPPAEPPPELKARIMAVVEREAMLLAAAGAGADADHPGPASAKAPGRPWWSRLRGRPAVAALGAAVLLGIGVVVGVLAAGGGGGGVAQTTHAVAASGRAAGAQGALVQQGDRAELRVTHMPPPPRGRVYQAWILRGARPRPDLVFTVDRAGRGAVVLDGDVTGAKAVLVTDEPPGGSRAPTTRPILSARPA